MHALTAVIGVFPYVILRPLEELMQPEVGDLEDPATVHHTVGRLELAVGLDLAVVQVDHALCTKHTHTHHRRGQRLGG